MRLCNLHTLYTLGLRGICISILTPHEEVTARGKGTDERLKEKRKKKKKSLGRQKKRGTERPSGSLRCVGADSVIF